MTLGLAGGLESELGIRKDSQQGFVDGDVADFVRSHRQSGGFDVFLASISDARTHVGLSPLQTTLILC